MISLAGGKPHKLMNCVKHEEMENRKSDLRVVPRDSNVKRQEPQRHRKKKSRTDF